MITKLKKIRNNIVSVISLQFLALILNIFTFGIIARILSVSDFGRFSYLLVVFGFIAKIIDFGINPIVFRETTKNNNFSEYLGSTLTFKAVLIFFLLIVINLFSYVNKSPIEEIVLLNLFVLNIYFSNKYTNIRGLLNIPFQVNLRMSLPMTLVLFDGVLLLILTILFQPFIKNLLYFVVIYVFANIPSTIVLLFLLIKNEKIILKYKKKVLMHTLKEALPIYGYSIFSMLYKQIDVFLLGILNDERSVALYSTSIRLSIPLMIVASAITVTFFPIIVEKLKNNRNIGQIVSSVIKTMLVISIAISLLISFHAEKIITFIFSEKYLLSSRSLIFLSISLVFSFNVFFFIDLLTALKKQKINFYYSLALSVLSIPFYLYILPQFSYVGAAVVRLVLIFIGSLFLFLYLLNFVKIKLNILRIITWILFNIFIFQFILNDDSLIMIIFKVLILFGSVFIFKIFNKTELNLIFSALLKREYVEKLNGFFK